jgi:protein-L-isoaspartate(D-aspartate) O-methyltransferase
VACDEQTGSPADLVRAARRAGVTDERVLAAMVATPRTAFVPAGYAAEAYADRPLPIPHGQVTTQPSLSAIMIAGLGLSGSEHVLEIGTGYGYQTALLSRLSASVVSVECWRDIAAQARDNLRAQGIRNVLVVVGDGTQGYAAGAPYDAILVSAAFPQVPPPLVSQLLADGRLVQPVGPGGREKVVLFQQQPEGLMRLRTLTSASFVRLHGRFGYPRADHEGHHGGE